MKACSRYMPSANDFIMLILGISESLYDGQFAPGAKKYDAFRPDGWIGERAMLKSLDYPQNAAGWREFMRIMVDLPVVRGGDANRFNTEHKANAAPKTAINFQDCNLALTYEWPWNGKKERG